MAAEGVVRARGRMLAWNISEGVRVNRLSGPWPMLLYTWLIPHADNLGRFHGEPEQIKALVLPRRRDVTVAEIETWMRELSDSCLILWYQVAGMRYMQFPEKDWNQHQRLRGNMRITSDLPPCTHDVRTAFAQRMHDVSPEEEDEGEGEEKEKEEGEGEEEPREEGATTPVTIADHPVRKRTGNPNRRSMNRGEAVVVVPLGLRGIVDTVDSQGIVVRMDYSNTQYSGKLVSFSHGEVVPV